MAGMVNVVNKCCEHEGCVKRPSFNFPNLRPARFCGQVFASPQYINARQHPPRHKRFSFSCDAAIPANVACSIVLWAWCRQPSATAASCSSVIGSLTLPPILKWTRNPPARLQDTLSHRTTAPIRSTARTRNLPPHRPRLRNAMLMHRKLTLNILQREALWTCPFTRKRHFWELAKVLPPLL